MTGVGLKAWRDNLASSARSGAARGKEKPRGWEGLQKVRGEGL